MTYKSSRILYTLLSKVAFPYTVQGVRLYTPKNMYRYMQKEVYPTVVITVNEPTFSLTKPEAVLKTAYCGVFVCSTVYNAQCTAGDSEQKKK